MGILGNEKANEWAKVAAAELDTRGRVTAVCEPIWEVPNASPRSLAHLKREIAEEE